MNFAESLPIFIRNHSYLDNLHLPWLASTQQLQTLGSMPQGMARGHFSFFHRINIEEQQVLFRAEFLSVHLHVRVHDPGCGSGFKSRTPLKSCYSIFLKYADILTTIY